MTPLARFHAFSALVFTPAFVPVIVLFWLDNGLDLTDVFLLQSLYAIATVLLEVPTGAVADRLGKRTSLLWATVCFLLGVGMYGLGTGFWTFLVAEIALAVGSALFSGADEGFLYDLLVYEGREDAFTEVSGRIGSTRMLVFAVANLVGGLVATWSLRATFFASLVGPVIALFLVLGLGEASTVRAASYGGLVRDSLRFVRKHQLVRWYVLLLAVLGASSQWLLWLYQPYMELAGWPIWAFGLGFAGFNLTAALAGRYAGAFERRLGSRGALVGLGVLQVVTPLAMALLVHPVSVLAVAGHQAVRGMMRPIVNRRILLYVYADKRSTVLSLGTLGNRLLFAVTAPIVGAVAGIASLQLVLTLQFVATASLLVALAWMWRRMPEKYFKVKDTVRAAGIADGYGDA
ncbi:MAG: MFS transporter [Alphaproteobacteria bacterium]|nr:MFS transporter [Alphaproteobacteria bacterium]